MSGGYPRPGDEWSESLRMRLPTGLRRAVAEAVDSGVVEVVDGHRFRLPRLPKNKGPYAFFSRSDAEVSTANWEYFVQVAEYWRLMPIAERRGLQVGFEDGLMDVTLRDDSELLWCIEMKEKGVGLGPLLAGIQAEVCTSTTNARTAATTPCGSRSTWSAIALRSCTWWLWASGSTSPSSTRTPDSG